MKTIKVNGEKVLGLTAFIGGTCLSGVIGGTTAKCIQESFKLPGIIGAAIDIATSFTAGTIIGYALDRSGIILNLEEPLITIDETVDDLVG